MVAAKNTTTIVMPVLEPTKAFHKAALVEGEKNVANAYVRIDSVEIPEGKTLVSFTITPNFE